MIIEHYFIIIFLIKRLFNLKPIHDILKFCLVANELHALFWPIQQLNINRTVDKGQITGEPIDFIIFKGLLIIHYFIFAAYLRT